MRAFRLSSPARGLALALLITCAAGGQAAAKSQAMPPCPNNFQGLAGGGPLTCACPPGVAGGTVWGTDIYTDDSSICRAAVHAGAISTAGGKVTVQPAAGQTGYMGSSRNGVTTDNYGNWGASFVFVTDAAVTGTVPCPANFEGLAGGGALTCACPPGVAGGTVWGTDIYTNDSSICRAAVHAGVISTSGGEVTVQPAPGQARYLGTSRNGVTTDNYGNWGASFVFAGGATAVAPCPDTFEGLGNGGALTCACPPGVAGGTVWGTDIYTNDSSICRAALHAGVISTNGGEVTVHPEPGQNRYLGTTRNGVTTDNYGNWGASFRF